MCGIIVNKQAAFPEYCQKCSLTASDQPKWDFLETGGMARFFQALVGCIVLNKTLKLGRSDECVWQPTGQNLFFFATVYK